MYFIGKIVCSLFMLFLLNIGTSADNYQFRHLTIEDGLSQGSVNCIMQDSKGFLWFGTQDGLNRFDGYQFKTFRANSEDDNSLSHNWIWDIAEDNDSNLWIATWHGLTKYNPKINKFFRYLPDSTDENSISGYRPSSICIDDKGTVWIATWGRGLNRYNPVTGKFRTFLFDAEDRSSIPGDYVREVYCDRKGRLWVGTWEGLALANVCDDGSVSFVLFRYDENSVKSIGSNQVMSVIEDHAGRIWIGTRGGGLNLFLEKDSSFIRFTHDMSDANTISSDDVCAVYEDRENRLWVGTFTEGLNLFNPESGKFTRIAADSDKEESLLSNSVYSILEDYSGLLWVGAGGLNILDSRVDKFGKFSSDNRVEHLLGSNDITGFYEDNSGRIWVGTDGAGLYCFDRTTGIHTIYGYDLKNISGIRNNSISAIAGNGTGKIWVATANGLDCLNSKTGIFTHIDNIPGVTDSYGLRYINSMRFSSENILWIATDNLGLIRYDISAHSAICFNSSQKPDRFFSGNSILSLFYGSDNKLWIGTWGIGLYSLDLQTNRIKGYMTTEKNSDVNSGCIVHSIVETPNKITGSTIWVGTSRGLLKMNTDKFESEGFQHITTKDGLPSNVVYAVLQDDEGFLWVSTNMGLSRIDVNSLNFRNFDVYDGLQSNEFSGEVCLKLNDGSLLFGGVGGFNLFNPGEIEVSEFQPSVVLTGFKVFNKDVEFGKAIYDVDNIVLPFKQNFFSLEFAALDFAKPSKIEYEYRMTGVDHNWVKSGNRRYVSYTNVPPGKYTFQVKATNRDGVVSDKLLSVNIEITPPYWQTWWFRLLIIAAALLTLYGIHRIRVEKLLAIEKLRVRIASDLHDDIGSSLTRISIISEQIQNSNDSAKIRDLSKRVGYTSREIVSTMSDIVWSIDSRNDSLNDLLDRMRDLVYKSLVLHDVKVTFKTSGFEKNRKIPVDRRQNLFYIFKEVINNIVKHSEASEVNIVLKNSAGIFYMEISDNGKSFDIGQITRGNGLGNIRMRADRLNAKLDIQVVDGVKITLVMKRV